MKTNFKKNKNNFDKSTLFEVLQKKNVLSIKEIVKTMDEKDIALFLEELPTNQQFFFIRSLPTSLAAEVFNLLDDDVVEKIIKSLTNSETQKIISFLYSDDIVELIEDLPPKLVKKILKSCSPKQRKNINHILNYPEETVGSEMNVEFIKLRENSKISDVIKNIQINIKKKIPEEYKYFYVVDKSDRLIGYISALELMTSNKVGKTIKDLIKKDVISIGVFESKEKLVELIQKYEIVQLPVVDMNDRLIGVVNTEQSFQIMEDVEIEDTHKQVGITSSGFKKYFELNIFEMFKSRIFWLSITLLISTISQIILKFFLEKQFQSTNSITTFTQVILPYLPFILTIVGNVALQSTAMIIKNITLNEVKQGNYFEAFIKEFKVSILILLSIIILNVPRALLIDVISINGFGEQLKNIRYWKNLGIATLVIVLSLLFSVFLSAGLPILATKFKKDPSLMSSPLLTTLIDLIITLIAMLIGYWLLQ